MKSKFTNCSSEEHLHYGISRLQDSAHLQVRQFTSTISSPGIQRISLPIGARAIWVAVFLFILAITLGKPSASANLYQVGDTVKDLTFIARREFTRPDGVVVPAGAPVKIQDFPGHVIFIEWFAVWCPFCSAAVPQVKSGIEEWYASRDGNPQGLPVLYLFVNQEPASFFQTQTTNYINANVSPETIVLNDYGIPDASLVRSSFQNSGQPVFVAINGLTNSPSHKPWQVLVNHLGYGDRNFNDELANFRSIIDSVQPGLSFTVLENPRFFEDNFEFQFQTQSGQTYRVQQSSNLVDWTTIQTITGTDLPAIFRHPNAPADANYYRVATP